MARGAPTISGVTGASGRVLVVDDNRVIRQLIRVNLELEGFEVVTAADGAECLEIVHSVRPDVVTLDVVMPRLDGVRTAARLRADARTRDVGIVMVSAGSPPESVSGPGGVDAYVAKPFEPALLVETVRRLIRRGGRTPAQPGGRQGQPPAQDPDRPAGHPAAHPPAHPTGHPHPEGQPAATPGPGPCS
nr:response regulator [Actinacidiphila yanglinensis]